MKEGHRSCSALSRRVGFIEGMPTGLGPRSGTCIKLVCVFVVVVLMLMLMLKVLV